MATEKLDPRAALAKMEAEEKAARDAELTITGKRFCSSCQSMKPALLGKMVEGKVNRWQCGDCTARRSVKKYKSKEKA
jgi:hypothetical protein